MRFLVTGSVKPLASLNRAILALVIWLVVPRGLVAQLPPLDRQELLANLATPESCRRLFEECPTSHWQECQWLDPESAYFLSRKATQYGFEDHARALIRLSAERGPSPADALIKAPLLDALRAQADWKALEAYCVGQDQAEATIALGRLEGLSRLGRPARVLELAASPGFAYLAKDQASAASLRAWVIAAKLALGRKAAAELRSEVMGQWDGRGLEILGSYVERDGGKAMDPSVLLWLRARVALARREYQRALALFSATPVPVDGGQAFFSDLGKAYLFGGKAAEGATYLAGLARGLPKGRGGEAGVCLLYAARCRLAPGQSGEVAKEAGLQARAELREAISLLGRGAYRDLAYWLLLDELPLNEALGLATGALGEWQDSAYFSDVLGRLVSQAVAAKLFGALDALRLAGSERLPSELRVRLSYISLRAASLGFIKSPAVGISPSDFLGDGPAGYYALLAQDLFPEAQWPGFEWDGPKRPDPNGLATRDRQGSPAHEAFLEGFFTFGLHGELPNSLRVLAPKIGDARLNDIAQRLWAGGFPVESILLRRIQLSQGPYPTARSDLEFEYPLAYRSAIEDRASRRDLDAGLFMSLVRTESYFVGDAVSRAGALGLCQIMPATGAELAARLGIKEYDLRDPDLNLELGAYYLSRLIAAWGDSPIKAIMAYNAGPGRMKSWQADFGGLPDDLFLEAVPLAETRGYGRKVLAGCALYGYLYYGRSLAAGAETVYPGLGGARGEGLK